MCCADASRERTRAHSLLPDSDSARLRLPHQCDPRDRRHVVRRLLQTGKAARRTATPTETSSIFYKDTTNLIRDTRTYSLQIYCIFKTNMI